MITELMQNVLCHTGDGGDIALTCPPDAVLIEVSDTSLNLPYPAEPDLQRPGGRGLSLVAAVSQAWGARRTVGGKVVWAKVAAQTTQPGTTDDARR